MEIEKDFIDLLTEHKALIYKVCFMYASNQEDLNRSLSGSSSQLVVFLS